MRTVGIRTATARVWSRIGLAAATAAAVAAIGGTAATTAPAAASPKIGHIFVITLENKGYRAAFGHPSTDPYLASTLPKEGALLTNYYGTGHHSNDNYVAMVSGQAPDPQNQADCHTYSNFISTRTAVSPGQAVGHGCVYPGSVPTVAGQLTAAGHTWKGYMEDMGNDPSREASVCAHPALNATDPAVKAVRGDGYVTRHDPFVYFHSIIDNQAYCDAHVVPLGTTTGALPPSVPHGTTGLVTDLKSVSTTPNLSFIVPNVCNDGHDYPCPNQPSGPSALADIDNFLATWVPKITASPAYRQDGLLVITFDEASGDVSACCNERPGPNASLPGITGPGGGRTGAVLLSPFIRPGTVSATPYNHYSLLASIESELGLPRLGYASTAPAVFGPDVFTG